MGIVYRLATDLYMCQEHNFDAGYLRSNVTRATTSRVNFRGEVLALTTSLGVSARPGDNRRRSVVAQWHDLLTRTHHATLSTARRWHEGISTAIRSAVSNEIMACLFKGPIDRSSGQKLNVFSRVRPSFWSRYFRNVSSAVPLL